MASNFKRVRSLVESLLKEHGQEDLVQRLSSKYHSSELSVSAGNSKRRIKKRLEQLSLDPAQKEFLADETSIQSYALYENNIENYIGTQKIPVGIAGPLRVNGLFAQGDYMIPLATTEAALVASYHRGCRVITESGGCTSILLDEGVSRAPGFIFRDISQAGLFIIWVQQQFEKFKEVAESTTNHGELIDMKVTVEGNHVYINMEFTTGDASGQNMVTIATEAICSYIIDESPVKPLKHFVEANLSGDKKATHLSFQGVRGKKVNSEVIVPADLLQEILHCSPEQLVEYWNISVIGGVLSSSIGAHGHYANGLCALYIATGQDAACVSESAVGLTRLRVTEKRDLYATVNLPNIIVGTVGGGTGLLGQKACLEIMGMKGSGKARAFAEICGALCLAGELSIMAAITSGDFTKAHQVLARKKGSAKQ